MIHSLRPYSYYGIQGTFQSTNQWGSSLLKAEGLLICWTFLELRGNDHINYASSCWSPVPVYWQAPQRLTHAHTEGTCLRSRSLFPCPHPPRASCLLVCIKTEPWHIAGALTHESTGPTAMTTFQQKKKHTSLFFYYYQPMKGTSFQQVISNMQLHYSAVAVKQQSPGWYIWKSFTTFV